MKEKPQEMGSDRLPSLDGWLAVSILLVLGAHSAKADGFPSERDRLFWWLFDGGLGVKFFFLISGFLITWLLLREDAVHGRVDLRAFYYRRCLRILPVYFAFLLVLWALSSLTAYRQDSHIWLANLTFTTNFLAEAPWPSAHLWSLAVEEQFYLLWPGLLVVAGLARNPARAGLYLGAAVILAPLWRLLTHHQLYPAALAPLFTKYSFFKEFDALAVGCLAAFAYSRYRPQVEGFVRRQPGRLCLIAVLLILLPKALGQFNAFSPVVIPFRESAQAFGMAMLLLQSIVLSGDAKYRWLNHPSVVWVGVLSYSLYIWQQLFCAPAVLYGRESVWWLCFPGWLIPAFVMAVISYYTLERPFMRLRKRHRKI
jgi:peptidoglycan/LPS O-acetylase OafA/YrhL